VFELGTVFLADSMSYCVMDRIRWAVFVYDIARKLTMERIVSDTLFIFPAT
jgi:hypothetical protein